MALPGVKGHMPWLAPTPVQSKAYDCIRKNAATWPGGDNRQANRIRRRDLRYSAAGFSRCVTALVEFFDEAYFARLPGHGGADQHTPIFIVGLPRSGTTLVEQIVSSHSGVCAGGESLAMPAVERRIRKDWAGGYPSALRDMGREAPVSLAQLYLAGLGALQPGATRKTDKLPGNFLSIGLIRTLLPQAAIVHCRRDLRDSCVSMYLNYSPDGNEHSFQLDELAAYAVDYQRVMAHWYARVGGIVTVDYERLVADQETESRALLTGLGLAWEPACLDFASRPIPQR